MFSATFSNHLAIYPALLCKYFFILPKAPTPALCKYFSHQYLNYNIIRILDLHRMAHLTRCVLTNCIDFCKFAFLHFCKNWFYIRSHYYIIKIYKYRLIYNSCFQKVYIAKCKNAKMQKCKFCSVIAPYRALSLHIVPYRAVSLLAQKKCCTFAPEKCGRRLDLVRITTELPHIPPKGLVTI